MGGIAGSLTVGRALAWGAEFLAARGVPAARRDARLLLGHALGVTGERLLSHPEAAIGERCRERFARLLERRGRREPVQYLLGEAEFYGRAFRVDPRVLIPRPETELLVEHCLRILADRAGRWLLADIGTGSGVLAVTLALELPQAEVHAVDIARPALGVAEANARRYRVDGRVAFHWGDLWAPLVGGPCRGRLDGAVANLPYVAEEELPALMPEVRLYEPVLALFGGRDGLDLYRALIAGAPPLLRRGAPLLLEVGCGQASRVAALMRAGGCFTGVEVVRDYAGVERVVVGFRR